MIKLFKGRSNMAHIMKCKPIPKVTTSSMLSTDKTKKKKYIQTKNYKTYMPKHTKNVSNKRMKT